MNGAHNAGGYEAMADASKDGIILDKQWLATHDERTRDSHAHLDGETVHYNEKFSNGLRYPQDPQGEAGEVYNCRCAMREIRRGFYNKYTGKTVMLGDAPQDEYTDKAKDYWDKYYAEKKQKEAELAAAENPNYSNKLLKNDGENGIIQINETPPDFKRITQVRASLITEKIDSGEYATKLSHQKYLNHIQGSAQYNNYCRTRIADGTGHPQSFLTIFEEETQRIIIEKSGTGITKADKNGNLIPEEIILCDKSIGKYYGGGNWHDTNEAKIKYGSKDAHLVPVSDTHYD